MKKNIPFTAFLLMLCLQAHAFNGAKALDDQPIATDIRHVFIPPEGYDDNDLVEIVIDGYLPSLCFDALAPEFSLDQEKRTITVKQNAVRKAILGCAESDTLSGPLQFPVSYTSVLNLGQLKAGEYTVMAQQEGQAVVAQKFKVGPAAIASIDNSTYAPIKSAFIPDMIYESNQAQLVLSGVLDSPCMRLNSTDIEVKKYDHMIVILPKLTLRNSARCHHHPRPLQAVVELGALTPGRYLVHVRTITGGSINRLFSVIEREQNGNLKK